MVQGVGYWKVLVGAGGRLAVRSHRAEVGRAVEIPFDERQGRRPALVACRGQSGNG